MWGRAFVVLFVECNPKFIKYYKNNNKKTAHARDQHAYLAQRLTNREEQTTEERGWGTGTIQMHPKHLAYAIKQKKRGQKSRLKFWPKKRTRKIRPNSSLNFHLKGTRISFWRDIGFLLDLAYAFAKGRFYKVVIVYLELIDQYYYFRPHTC